MSKRYGEPPQKITSSTSQGSEMRIKIEMEMSGVPKTVALDLKSHAATVGTLGNPTVEEKDLFFKSVEELVASKKR